MRPETAHAMAVAAETRLVDQFNSFTSGSQDSNVWRLKKLEVCIGTHPSLTVIGDFKTLCILSSGQPGCVSAAAICDTPAATKALTLVPVELRNIRLLSLEVFFDFH